MEFPACFPSERMSADSSRTSAFQAQTDVMDLNARGYEGSTSTLFNDPAQVQQWAATSATRPMDSSANCAEPMHRDISRSSSGYAVSDALDSASLSSLAGHDAHEVIPIRNTLVSASVVPNVLAFPTDRYGPFSNSGLDAQTDVQCDEWMPKDTQTLGYLDAEASLFTDNLYLDTREFWLDSQSPSQEEGRLRSGAYSSGHTSWSSPSTNSVEPSFASSYPQDGTFPGFGGSPTALSVCEELGSVASNEEPMLSPLNIGGPVQGYYGMDSFDPFDAPSTLRPSNGFQRPPMPLPPFWTSNDHTSQGACDPSADIQMYRRPSADGENNARHDRMYQIGPKDDGLYYCPFADTEGCAHKPEKLKCNYDKHLDAHLKPYRCKDLACHNVPFSSTACLLRHEREAHGMHGHGDKPYLCSYEDCERRLPGNGFPRRWNLQDHMKRVHDYTVPLSNEDGSSALETPNARSSRKKKAATGALNTKRVKATTITKANSKASLPTRQTRSIQKQFQEYVPLQDQWTSLPSAGAQGQEQFREQFSVDISIINVADSTWKATAFEIQQI